MALVEYSGNIACIQHQRSHQQSTRPTRLHIRNLLDRRFGTIFLYNNDSFMISILLHRQNLNLVILDERNYLKDFVIWCKDRRWCWHDKFHWSNATSTSPSANNRPLSSIKPDHHSNQLVAVWKSEEEANLTVSPLTDFTGPHWGANHIGNTRSSLAKSDLGFWLSIGLSWRRPPSVNLVDSHAKLTARCILCLLLQAGIYRGRWVYFWLQIPS